MGDSTSYVYSLLANDSRLYVGGKFTQVDESNRQNLAAFSLPSGALDSVWKTKARGQIRKLMFASDERTIFAVGAFKSVIGSDRTIATRQSVARFATDTGNVDPWAVPEGTIEVPMTARDVVVTPTRLYVAFGLKPNYVAAFRLDNGNSGDRIWRANFVGNPQTLGLSPDGSRLIVGGHFGINPLDQRVCDNKYLKGLVGLNPVDGTIDCSWIPSLDQKSRPDYDGGWTITTVGDQLWVGGGFIGVSGVPQYNLARFTYDPTLKTVNAVPKVDLDGLQRAGLDATYFDNMDFTGTQVSRIDPTVNFDWGSTSPDPGIGPDTFSARWTGQVEAPVDGDYTFTTTSDDGIRLFVDGKLVVDDWTDHAPANNSVTVTLKAGKRYDLQLDYYENGGGAVAKLLWSYPSQPQQVVPSNRLFNSSNVDYSATYTAGTGPTTLVDQNNLTVIDADDINVKSAKVTLTNRPDGTSESISVDTSGTSIVADYDPQTGVLRLDGPATKADFEQVLRTTSYNNISTSPNNIDRAVTFTLNDGTSESGVATSTITIH